MDPQRHNEAFSVYREILYKLEALRQKENKERVFTGAVLFALGVVGILLVGVVAEAIFRLGVVGRTYLFWLIVAVSVFGFSLLIAAPLLRLTSILRSSDDETLAEKVGDYFTHIKDRLLNLLQLHREREKSRSLYSPELIDAAFEDLRDDVAGLDFAEVITYERPRKFGKSFGLLTLGALLLILVFPSALLDSARRLVHYRQEFAVPLAIRFDIWPGNVDVVRGEDVRFSIGVEGKAPDGVALYTRREGEVSYDRTVLKSGTDGKFAYEISSIKSSTQYYAAAHGVESEKYRITVIDRPAVKNLRLRLTYPSYTGVPPRDLEDNVGDVTAIFGTKVDIEARANKELAKASLAFSDRTEQPMKVAGLAARAQFNLSKDRTYHILLADEKGIQNSDPIEYQLKVIYDETPTVSIVLPGRDLNLTDDRQLPLLLKLRDDFGFTRLRLGYRLVYSRYERPAEEYSFLDLPLEKPRSTELNIPFLWNLRGLNLVTEDVVSYFAEVHDNDAVSGPKVGKSQTYTIRVPSLDEILADVEESHRETIGDLKQATEGAKELKKQLDEINQDLKKSREQLNWEKQRKAEELMKRYEEMQKNLLETSRKLDQIIQEMEKNNLISPETLEKYLELQQLFEQINSPELREAIKKLQEALRNLNPEQLREALQKFTFSEEQFRRSLERTLSILKRIHIEQKLEEALRRTAELLQQQEEIRKETQQTDPKQSTKREELSERQRGAKKDLESLEKELSGLEEKMLEFPEEMPLEEMREAMEKLAKRQLGESMERSIEGLQSGGMDQAASQQREVSSGLQQLLKDLQGAQQMMLQKQQQQIVRDLKKMFQDLLELSKEQEALKQECQLLEPNSQRFREMAQEQMRVMTELTNLTNSMMKLSQRTLAVTPGMGKAVGKALSEMNEAMGEIESRNSSGASQHQGGAMGSLNEAATMVLNSLQLMMRGGGGGLQSLLQQLRQLIAQQQGINTATLNLDQLNAMTMDQQAEMARLAAEQGAVQKSLAQLSEEARRSAERERILGDLGKISEEMREVVKDLEQQNVNPETIRKQERILSRLLDAQRSMRERDFEKRRRAEPGKDVVGTSPKELDLTTQEGRNRLMEDLLKALEEGYAKDYEELIRKYFEALQKIRIEGARSY